LHTFFEGRAFVAGVSRRPPRVFLSAALFFLLLAGAPQQDSPQSTLVILSLDGVRHDYPDRVKGGAFQRLEKEGVRADRLIPPFPASTFPGHATLATGCYPERHGILNSKFLDSRRGIYDREDDPEWLACEPLWVNAERAHLSAAVLNWVGSFGSWKGVGAAEHASGFSPKSDRETLKEVLDLLRRPPARRPRLVMAYLAGADHTGHETGPDSPAMEGKIRILDGQLNAFLNSLDRLSANADINLILVSDHGMASRRAWLDFQGILFRHHIRARGFASGGTANVYLTDRADRSRAMKVLASLPGLEVFPSDGLPANLHYEFPGRTGDLVIVAPLGVELGRNPDRGGESGGGVHGYRGTDPLMGGIFYGRGPAFRAGIRAGGIEAVDVYSLACAVLGIHPSARAQGTLPTGILKPRRGESLGNPGR
jgi:predicted AlkP superfamily pyrophosphatase or phosphodiesterase